MSVLCLQAALKSLGFDPGPLDGKDGPATRAAVRKWLGEGTVEVDDNTRLLLAELHRDEGRVLHAYQDHLGYWTIGTGRLIDKRRSGGISDLEADHLLMSDIARIRLELDDRIPWWRDLDPVRQRAVQNMAFQLGTGDFDGATFRLIRDGEYARAAARLRGWKWAKQTPARAERVIRMIETGKVG